MVCPRSHGLSDSGKMKCTAQWWKPRDIHSNKVLGQDSLGHPCILASPSIRGDRWDSLRQTGGTGPQQQEGLAHICDRRHSKDNYRKGGKLRITYKLSVSSSACFRHLLKCPKEGKLWWGHIPSIADKHPPIPLAVKQMAHTVWPRESCACTPRELDSGGGGF